MPMIQRKLQVNYSAADMFQLVDDVECYSQFLPWCKSSAVLSRTDNEVSAMLMLSAKGLQKSFTTLNRLQKNKLIEISLLNGPFRRLEGFWRFYADSEKSCTVQFDLEFEFSGKFLSLAFSPFFHQVANTLIDAFSRRADQIYGK